MGKVRIVFGIALLTLFLCLIGCGGGSMIQRGSGPGQDTPQASAPALAQLPPPSALHGASYTQEDLSRWGSEYDETLPQDNVVREVNEAVFIPDWVMPGGQFSGLAYATFQFNLDGFDLNPSLLLTWTQTSDFSDGWAAFADFSQNRWDWHQLPQGGILMFDPANNISETGVMYVITLLTGTAEWRLEQLQIGVDNRSDWWMFGHDSQHTRRSHYVGPQSNSLKWSYTTGGSAYSSPAIAADGTIYFGSEDDKLYALNPDGSLKWTFTTGGNVRSSPAIGVDGTIYIGSIDYNLYAISPSGVLKWVYTTGNLIWESSPTIGSDGTIYIGSGNRLLHAVNPDGSMKWICYTDGRVRSSPAIGFDGTLYVGCDDEKFYAINPDGSHKWIYSTDGNVRSSPAVGSDGTIYVCSADGRIYAFNPDGSIKWIDNMGSASYSSPAIGEDGTIYVGNYDGKVCAYSPIGSLLWTFQTEGEIDYSSPTIDSSGTLYIGSWDNSIYAISSDGKLIWSYETSDIIWSSPAIGFDGTLYVGSNDGKLYAIGSGSG